MNGSKQTWNEEPRPRKIRIRECGQYDQIAHLLAKEGGAMEKISDENRIKENEWRQLTADRIPASRSYTTSKVSRHMVRSMSMCPLYVGDSSIEEIHGNLTFHV